VLALYRLATFLSAALLFTVQPMFTRLVLPILGGAPSVWTTAQVFFQVALLAGYGYAHLGTRALGVRRQARAHVVLLLLPLLVLPLTLSRASAPPPETSPVPWLLFTMLVTVGPPFFVLSAGGPLLLRWFSATGHPRARDPYFLYAASNLGSMLALVAYPTLIEPSLRLPVQTRLWAWLYGLLALLMAACAFFIARATPPEAPAPADSAAAEAPTRRRILRWIALAFVPSSLMLGATTHLTTDVAAAPVFWILPLALYLLTFILPFMERPIVPHRHLVRAAPVAITLGVIASASPIAGPVWLFLSVILLAFFVIAMVCHGELARDRPSPRHLTGFFFWISAGGALGGAFGALLAPILFRTVIEYSVTLVAAALLLPAREAPEGRPRHLDHDGGAPLGVPRSGPEGPAPPAPAPPNPLDLAMTLVVGAACGAAIVAKRRGFLTDATSVMVSFAALSHIILMASPRPVRLGLSLGVVLFASHLHWLREGGVLLLDRSFFGALAVTEQGGEHARRSLLHGATRHGVQAIAPEARAEPLSYFSEEGPIGQVFRHGPIRPDARVAVVGLGVGSLMAYAQPSQRWTFYEIDPLVVKIARDPRNFTYLADAKAPHAVVLGDARRSLSAEAGRFSLIVLDAYSSDAVPIHLLTREAVEIYLGRLEDGGILALHISNRHLDLGPVVAGIAGALGLVCLEQNAAVSPSAAARGEASSRWAILARRREDLGAIGEDRRWIAPAGKRVLWTDDASSLIEVWSGW
jgi:hypothetical protein